jgi:hypothetical protein
VDGRGQSGGVSEHVAVEAARIPDRDRLLGELRDAGLDARAVDEVSIEVRCDADEDASDDILHRVEGLVMSIGAPFVPQKHEGVIYIRPPVS